MLNNHEKTLLELANAYSALQTLLSTDSPDIPSDIGDIEEELCNKLNFVAANMNSTHTSSYTAAYGILDSTMAILKTNDVTVPELPKPEVTKQITEEVANYLALSKKYGQIQNLISRNFDDEDFNNVSNELGLRLLAVSAEIGQCVELSTDNTQSIVYALEDALDTMDYDRLNNYIEQTDMILANGVITNTDDGVIHRDFISDFSVLTDVIK